VEPAAGRPRRHRSGAPFGSRSSISSDSLHRAARRSRGRRIGRFQGRQL
jgi:hypothetical protein